MTACDQNGKESRKLPVFDEIVIEYQEEQNNGVENVIVSDDEKNEISKAYASMIIESTSMPMGFPRLNIYFREAGNDVANWRIDSSSVTSGSELGLGNHLISGNESMCDFICGFLTS